MRETKINNSNQIKGKKDMNKSVIVKVEMSGNRYNAFDKDGVKYTSAMGTGTRKRAYQQGMALERRVDKNGRNFWWKVPMSEFEAT